MFFFPNGTSDLNEDTWVQLDEFYELDKAGLIKKGITSQINEICQLEKDTTVDLLNCAINSDDISFEQKTEVKNALKILKLNGTHPP